MAEQVDVQEQVRSSLPSYWAYMPTVIEVLRDRGGSAPLKEVVAEVPRRMSLTPEQTSVLHDPEDLNRTEIRYRLAWAGTFLRKAQLIESLEKGIWALTRKGWDVRNLDGKALAKDIRERFWQSGDADEPTEDEISGETYLFAWNPKNFEWPQLQERIRSVLETGTAEERWSCGSVKSIPPGSRFYLIRLGQDPRGLIGAGVTEDEVYEAPHYQEERAAHGEKARFVPLRFDSLAETPLIARAELDLQPFGAFKWDTQMSGIRIPRDVARALQQRWQKKVKQLGRAGAASGPTEPRPQFDLRSNQGLRDAAAAIEAARHADASGADWGKRLRGMLEWVRASDEKERSSLAFQKRLWDDNHVAAVGQGNLPVDEALNDPEFRRWLSGRSMQALPSNPEEKVVFLRSFFDDIKIRLIERLSRKKTPKLKIFRVLTALYPEGMTTIASESALAELARAMGGDASLDAIGRHVWIRSRLDEALDPIGASVDELVYRIRLPWLLLAEVVRRETERRELSRTPPEPEESKELSIQAIIQSVQQSGHFGAGTIARLHAGLWANERRHFVVLTGLSGAGKTLLARSYAKALAPSGTEAFLLTIPVQPGWHDPSALLGYPNPLQSGAYVRTQFLQFLIDAAGDPGRRYVAVLDEMNLSHPEQYLAPLLSAMETGEPVQLHGERTELGGVPSSVAYPSNLALIGTVNMDETTHGLSDKVLDRAFVIDFWRVDLDAYPGWGKHGLSAERVAQVRGILQELMKALEPARLHFGWRVVDDVLEFVAELDGEQSGMTEREIVDAAIYAKVLPKIRGEDSARLRSVLDDCRLALTAAGLPDSLEKIMELRKDLEVSGSARFWR